MTKDAIGSLRGLERLDQAYKKARTDAERRLIMIRRACFMARLSRIPEARAHLDRALPDRGAYEPMLNGWALYCDGLIEHFDSLGPNALSKFRRAYAVSVSVGDRELAAITSAWIASREFAQSNIGGFASHLRRAFEYAEETNWTALSRACTQVADALAWSGSIEQARPWYQRARRHAVDDADLPMQIVVLYNEAAFKVTSAVVSDCQGNADLKQVGFTLISLDSVGALDVSIGRDRLTSAIPLLRASALTIQERWDEAVALLDVFLADSSVHTTGRQFGKYLAERAYCKVKLEERAGALVDVDAALKAASTCSDLDDLFVLHSRTSQVLEACGQRERAQDHRNAAARCLRSFEIEQHAIREQLDPVVNEVLERAPSWLG